jgi:ATP-binding cassette, subfamily B, bacterial
MSARLTSSFGYRTLLVTYLRPQWRQTLLLGLLVLASIIVQLANPQILRQFIDQAVANQQLSSLLLSGCIFVALALLNQAITVYSTYVGENLTWTTTNQLRTDLLTHCMGLDMAFHKVHTSGELIERIDGDVNTLSNFLSQSMIQFFGSVLLIIGVIILLFWQDWRIGTAIGLFALVAFLLLLAIRNYAIRYWVQNREKDADFFSFLSEQLTGTEDVRANGATGYVMQRFYQLLSSWLPIRQRSSIAGYSVWMTTLLIFSLGTAIALALGAYLWSTKAITAGAVYLIFYYTNLLNDPLEQIRAQMQQMQEAGAGIERIRQLLQTQPTIHGGTATLPAGALSVEFSDVSFGYNADDPILHHLNFSLPPGRILGILGRTGSGKTTLARLLLRLYDVQQGSININGIPITELQLPDLRQHIGMVTQDVQLFHASVRDNLTFFNRSIDDHTILRVISDVGLLSWYQSLAHGLDTEMGSDGEGLSAGEAQLLAFTRVFLTNPGLVILDEASSRLDPATEQLIEHAVYKLLANRTAIIIAHRLTTIQRADDIMVMANGEIIEYDTRLTLAQNSDSRFAYLLRTGLEEVRS